MSETNPNLERLADRIGELQSIDWELATRESGLVPDTAISENLRILAQIASFEAEALLEGEDPRHWGPFGLTERRGVDEEGERWSARGEGGEEIELLWPPTHHHDPGHARVELIAAARKLVGLRDEHRVEILGADAFDGRLGIWMRPSPGPILEERVRAEGPVAPDEWTSWMHQLCLALEAVHGRKLYMQALPPSGVVLDEAGGLKVRRLPHLRAASALRPDERLPALSAHHFAAPESLVGAAPTMRAEVFTIAALMVWAAGEDPKLEAIDTLAALRAHRAHAPELHGLPEAVASLLRAGLHPEPNRRPAGPRELREAWQEAVSGLESDAWTLSSGHSFWQRLLRRLRNS